MKGASHVVLRGLVLEACRGTAVRIDGGSHNQVVGCTIRNTGNRAVIVRGTDHALFGCDIYETGEGGIALAGATAGRSPPHACSPRTTTSITSAGGATPIGPPSR